MSTTPERLTLAQFHEQYPEALEPHWEYWFGEPVQKPLPTKRHSVLQYVVCAFLDKAGFAFAGPEVTLRVDPEWQPVADVVADSPSAGDPYPAKPVDVVAEILSPEDRLNEILEKCGHYARIGTRQILVFDPRQRRASEWDSTKKELSELAGEIILPNGYRMSLPELWAEFERRMPVLGTK